MTHRLSTFKAAIRQCAKLGVAVDVPSSKPSSPRGGSEGEDLLDPKHSAVMESLMRNLRNYLGTLTVRDPSTDADSNGASASCTSTMSTEELAILADELERAESVPVTAHILQVLCVGISSFHLAVTFLWVPLQSAAYKPLTKIIRSARGKSDGSGKDGIAEIQQKCISVGGMI